MKKIMGAILILCTVVGYAQGRNSWRTLNKEVLKVKGSIKKADACRSLALHFAAKPKSVRVHLDSAYIYATKALRLSEDLNYHHGTGMANLLLSRVWRERKNHEKGRPYLEKAFKIAKNQKLKVLEGEAWRESAYYFGWGAEQQDRIRCLEKAIPLFRDAQAKDELAETLASLAEQYTNVSEHRKAIVCATESVRLCRQKGKRDLFLNLYDILGICYTKIGLYEQGIKYSLAAAREGSRQGDQSLQMASIYNNLGLAHYFNLNYTEAERFHLLALELAEANGDDNYMHVVLNNIVNDLVHAGSSDKALVFYTTFTSDHPAVSPDDVIMDMLSLIAIYADQEKHAQVERLTSSLLSLTEKNKASLRQSVIYNVNSMAIKHHLDRGEYGAAKRYLATNKEIAAVTEDEFYRRSNFLLEFRLDSLSGNYKSAYTRYKLYSDMSKAAADKDRENQIALLQLEYDAEAKSHEIRQKEKNIEILQQDARVQQAKLDNDRTRRIVMLAIFGSLLLVAAILGYSLLMKRRSNRTLELKQAEIEQKNTSLENLVEEKEWLLKEIHHRVKNNLQIVMSLLNSQSAFLTDNAAIAAIQNSQHRVNAMSLIHQRLYTTDNVSSINVKDYVGELLAYLKDSFNVGQGIRFLTDIEDVELDAGPAVPFGLILNEAVTNAIKHAFPEGSGTISIKVRISDEDEFVLTVTDNGVGIDNAPSANSGLGIRLIRGLSQELDAKLSIQSENDGTSLKLSFNYQFATFNS